MSEMKVLTLKSLQDWLGIENKKFRRRFCRALITSLLHDFSTFDNWYYTMFSLKKTRKTYQKPRINEAVVDLEGLVCTSGFEKTQVDRLHNINAEPESSSYYEPLNLEF